MKNPTSRSGSSPTKTEIRHIENRYVYRRDLSQPREERKIAKNMAEQLQMMEEHITRIPEIDLQRRHKIRMAIATGNYVIDPITIAEKFLKFEKDLFG